MKKFMIILSIFLFLSFTISEIPVFAKPDPQAFTQGLYKVKDSGLSTGINYSVRNTSPTGRAVVIIFDENQMMQEFIRLEPDSPNYTIKPLNFDNLIIVVGGGSVSFS